MGSKNFLAPMLEAQFAAVPKKVMHCVFHFISVNFVLATVVLVAAGVGVTFGRDATLAVMLIAAQFALYGVVQILMVLVSGIEKGLFRIFQWTFFLVISALAWVGILL